MDYRHTAITCILSIILTAAVLLPSDFSYHGEVSAAEKGIVNWGGDSQTDVYDEESGGVGDLGIHVKLQDDSMRNRSGRQRSSRSASVYDPRGESWFSGVKVRDQQGTGLCWAFSATVAAEISYAYKHQEQSPVTQLSPVHLGYFFYNRVNDPLGNTKGDRNIMVKDSDSGIFDYTDAGGNNYLTFQALAGWTGLAAESKAPFEKWSGRTLRSSLAYDDEVVIRNADILRSGDDIKAALMRNGSVSIGIYMSENRYLVQDTGAYNCDADINSNHVVTIIGWDDTYSRENFRSSHRPDSDGAWIAQNSYGTDWGDAGYFYISYEDASLENALTMEVQAADTYEYNYQYDGNAAPSGWPLLAGEKAANVFTVPRDGRSHFLEATAFTTMRSTKDLSGDMCGYDIAVYTDLKDPSSPVSGKKRCSFSVSLRKSGYHTVDITEHAGRIYLEPGSSYSVVVTVKDDVDIGAECRDYRYDWIKFRCSLSGNQSFWYGQAKAGAPVRWHDSYDDDMCTRIKAFTNTEASMTSKPSSFKTSLYGYDDVKLSWSRVSGADGYRVKYRKQGETYYRTLCHTAGTSVKKKDLADGRKYYFRVEPYRTTDGVRYYSSGYRSGSIYTLKKVSGVRISKASGSQVKVRWTAVSGASGYQIARSAHSSSGFRTVKSVSSRYTSSKISVSGKRTFHYKVRAYRTEAGKKIYGPWSQIKGYRLR